MCFRAFNVHFESKTAAGHEWTVPLSGLFWVPGAACADEPGRFIASRSPSTALLPTFLGRGSPTKIDYRKKPGTNLF